MGNWRTINIVGSIPTDELEAARKTCFYDYMNFDNVPKGFQEHALCYGSSIGLCGIGRWPDDQMNVTGNCFERDYDVEMVADALRIVVKAAPGARIKIHCGDDYEKLNCVATITYDGGEVVVGDPEIETLREIGEEVIRDRFARNLLGDKRAD